MGGYQQLVRGDVMRGKFRNSFEKPEPFEPGKPTRGEVHAAGRLPHASAAGHRIMVQVQSSWFPLVDRNPQTFVDIYTREGVGLSQGDAAGVSHEGSAVASDGTGVAVGQAARLPRTIRRRVKWPHFHKIISSRRFANMAEPALKMISRRRSSPTGPSTGLPR